MEIFMKLKCTPSTSASNGTQSTLKIVDQHHQLQQKHTMQTGPSGNLQPPPPCLDCCPPQNILQGNGEPNILYDASGRPSCCTVGNGNTPPCCSGMGAYINTPPPPPPPLNTYPPPAYSQQNDFQWNPEDFNARYEYHEPEENFVSIDDANVRGMLYKIGREQRRLRRLRELQRAQEQQQQERELEQQQRQLTPPSNTDNSVVYEIIELDDEDEQEKLRQIKEQATNVSQIVKPESGTLQDARTELQTRPTMTRRSPDISLIPKIPENKSEVQTIVAEIDLLDSSDSEQEQAGPSAASNFARDNVDDDDSEELPLAAAAAVSCELEVDEDFLDNADGGKKATNESCSDDVVIVRSDDEQLEYIDEDEEGIEVRWDDLECQRSERNMFECYVCHKRVQSSYNLRRHMMIHTGERPFGCDMCDRRFREFSDLKKHRRRHINEPNFLCMVCRLNPPTEHDATRCASCDSKNLTLKPSHLTTAAAAAAAAIAPTPVSISKAAIVRAPPTLTRKPPSPNQTVMLLTNSSSPKKCADTPALPPLTPIGGHAALAVVGNTINSGEMQMLDNIPAVHRLIYNQSGDGSVSRTRKEYPCPQCQRAFGTRHNLKRHFMIHSGEKPFNCVKCRKPFREYSTLKKHMVTHQRDRWYKCLRCPLKYRDYLEYLTHKTTHPERLSDTDAELTNNTNTSTSSNSNSQFRKKLKSKHIYEDNSYEEDSNEDEDDGDGANWLECCECGERFTDFDVYTEHLKEHNSSFLRFECYICKQSFETRNTLEQHMAKHNSSAASISVTSEEE